MSRYLTALIVLLVVPGLPAQEGKTGQDQPIPQAATAPQPPSTQPAGDAAQYAKLETTLGDIVLELDGQKAPATVKNFLGYVDSGFYNGTIFHRVMSNFMIQGGGYTPEMDEKKEGLQPPIKNEWQNGLKNVRGSIAMARLGNQPDSATCQFFINVVDNPALDQPRDGAAYAVFGKVIAGMDTVDKIHNTEVGTHPKLPMGAVVPKTPVIIKAAKRLTPEEAQAAARQAEAAAAEAQAEAKAAAEKQMQEIVARYERASGNKMQKTASGLMSIVLQPGDGPSPQPTDVVEVHYVGTLLDGKEFDSSLKRGRPARFGLNQVIKGWTEGVGLMKVGEKRVLIIPPELAYGPQGRPGIPPNSTLVFEVELLAINPPQP